VAEIGTPQRLARNAARAAFSGGAGGGLILKNYRSGIFLRSTFEKFESLLIGNFFLDWRSIDKDVPDQEQ
jgi:hypothetical protein